MYYYSTVFRGGLSRIARCRIYPGPKVCQGLVGPSLTIRTFYLTHILSIRGERRFSAFDFFTDKKEGICFDGLYTLEVLRSYESDATMARRTMKSTAERPVHDLRRETVGFVVDLIFQTQDGKLQWTRQPSDPDDPE
jgi:hypothetical protein